MSKIFSGILNTQDPRIIKLAQEIEITAYDTRKLQYWLTELPPIEHPITIATWGTRPTGVHPGRTRLLYSVIADVRVYAWLCAYTDRVDTSFVQSPRPRRKLYTPKASAMQARIEKYQPIQEYTFEFWQDYYARLHAQHS